MIYKARTILSHRVTGEKLPRGTFITDEGNFDPEGEIEYIKGIPFRPGFISGRTQLEKNYLIGNAIDIIDEDSPDYPTLVEAGIIKIKQVKKKKDED